MALTNSFPHGAFPEYRLNCRQQSNGAWRCSPVEEQWVGFVELKVVCNNEDKLHSCLPHHGLTISPPLMLVVVYWQLSH